ncbi:MAG: hypothetical protein WDA42_07790 [Candidatus Bathyarchaeia archaeon]|jgi:hypothetical protein
MPKKCTYAWVKGKKVFPSIGGVKNSFAYDLIIMGDIELYDEFKLNKITPENASAYLENMGWRWHKLDYDLDKGPAVTLLALSELEVYIKTEYAKIKNRKKKRDKCGAHSLQYAHTLDTGKQAALKELAKYYEIDYK